MREISIEKLTLNIGVGEPGAKLEKSQKLLEAISGMKAVQTKAKKRIPTWKLRPGLAIGTKVTLRGKKAEELLKRLFASRDNSLKRSSFDNAGNLSFGITEYISIPGAEYDASIGIIGLEANVTFQRPGYRIRRRRLNKCAIPKKHIITQEEAINHVSEKYGVTVI